LALVIALVTGALAALGGHLAATKRWHRWAFWGGAVVVWILIGIQTFRNERAQGKLEDRLAKIEHNTETPPKVVVNVPQSAPPMITVAPPSAAPIIRDTRGDLVGEVEVVNTPLVPNAKINFNLKLLNRNSPPVDGVWRYFSVGIGTIPNLDDWTSDADIKVDREMRHKFHQDAMKEAKLHKTSPGITIETGKGIFNSLALGPLTQENVDSLIKGKTRIYTYIWGRWKNSSRDLEECMWMQPPTTTEIDNQHVVWHACTP
jgi:hypothetical protein